MLHCINSTTLHLDTFVIKYRRQMFVLIRDKISIGRHCVNTKFIRTSSTFFKVKGSVFRIHTIDTDFFDVLAGT